MRVLKKQFLVLSIGVEPIRTEVTLYLATTFIFIYSVKKPCFFQNDTFIVKITQKV